MSEWPKPKEHPMQAELRNAPTIYELTWFVGDDEKIKTFTDYEEARADAYRLAEANKGTVYYLGSAGCHPMSRTYYQWDRRQNRVIPCACND